MTIDRNQAIDILGRTGEKIIANLLTGLGLKVEESINHFDSEKDFLVDGKKVEVKTEQPYVRKNAFTFRENQLRKCQSVDVLYFVSIPPLIEPDYRWGGWIFRVDPRSFQYHRYTTKFGIRMIAIPIHQNAMVPVCKMKEEEIRELVKYANSAYAR